MFKIHELKGDQVATALDDIALLRLTVFKEWPYLYDGNLDYEKNYLKTLQTSDRALCLLIKEGDLVVGVSTLMPLIDEHDELKAPLITAGYDIKKIFYFAETCLLPQARGHGLYKDIFKSRESYVRSFGRDYRQACFCGVLRPANHPLRPMPSRPLDSVWKKYGYNPIPNLFMSFSWKDIGEREESKKSLQVWMKDIL